MQMPLGTNTALGAARRSVLDTGLAPESTPRLPSKGDVCTANPCAEVLLLHGPFPWALASNLDPGHVSDWLCEGCSLL